MVGGDIESGTRTLFYRRAAIKGIVDPQRPRAEGDRARPRHRLSGVLRRRHARLRPLFARRRARSRTIEGLRCGRRHHRPSARARTSIISVRASPLLAGVTIERVGDCVAPSADRKQHCRSLSGGVGDMSALSRVKNQLVRCLYQLTCAGAANSVTSREKSVAGRALFCLPASSTGREMRRWEEKPNCAQPDGTLFCLEQDCERGISLRSCVG